MTNTNKLAVRLSEIRQRLNEISVLEGDDLTDEVREESGKLQKEYSETEERWRASTVAEAEVETTQLKEENPEMRALVQGASLSDIIIAAANKSVPEGQTKELQEALGIGPNQIPMAMLTGNGGTGKVEERAATHTPAPTDGVPNQQTFVPAVFPASVAEFLGIPRPTVAAGSVSYHVLSTNLSANLPAAGAAGANTAGAFDSKVLEPRRAQGAFVMRREDMQRLGPQLEASLRENLSEVLMSLLDAQLIVGDGLLGNAITAPGNPDGVADYDDYVGALAEQVDGIYANETSDVRMLIGPATYQHMLRVYRTGSNTERSALERVRELSGGVRASAHVPGVAAKRQGAVAARATGLIHMVQPVWEGPTAVVDPYTRADQGEIVITLVALYAQSLVRAAGFDRLLFQVVA